MADLTLYGMAFVTTVFL